jgi:uncharacterized protein (TIGR02646 family)
MHRLYREPVVPGGLDGYDYRHQVWGPLAPTPDERVEIWLALDAMQGQRCAYCEAPIADGNRHLEHFRQRNGNGGFARGTFDWANIFGSCNRGDTCGRHKDRCGAYDHRVLVKPDIEDPEDFFDFIADGTICPRVGLDDASRIRAEQTLRILNPHPQRGALREMRRSHVAGYVQTAEEIAALAAEFPLEEWMPFLAEELAATQHLPFATAIKHTLTGR